MAMASQKQPNAEPTSLGHVSFLPIITESGDPAKICEDCYSAERLNRACGLFAVWAFVSVTLLLIGPAIAGTLVMMTGALKMGGAPGLPVVFGNRLHEIRIWANTLVSSGGTVAVSVTLGQIRRDQQVFDNEEGFKKNPASRGGPGR